jgi:trehalose synthase-fused probable maltokinase
VLARITGARKGAVIDGLQDDDVCDRLLAMIERDQEHATRKGSIRGLVVSRPSSVVSQPPAAVSPHAWQRGPIDQSNSVAFADDRLVLKLFRRIEPIPNPEYEIGRVLTERRFERTPALVGAVEYMRPMLEPGTLAVVQTMVKHQGSGWQYTVDDVRRYFERVAARTSRSDGAVSPDHPARPPRPGRAGVEEPPPFFAALENWYLSSATTLGRRTAEMHLTLASAGGDAFEPEPLTGSALADLAANMQSHAEASLTLLAERAPTLNDAARPYAEAVLRDRDLLVRQLDAVRTLDGAGMRIRVHGDYHLGQVLRTEEDFVIIDFEGEPGRSIAERRAKQSPLKDVAGMIRSFSYAAYAALFAFTLHAPDEYAPLEPWADTWRYWASSAFLRGYLQAMDTSMLVPRGRAYRVLIDAFTIDKALYELGYELNNRPEWVRIPLIGIEKLIAPGAD